MHITWPFSYTGRARARVNRKQIVCSAVGCLVAENTVNNSNSSGKSKTGDFFARTDDDVELLLKVTRVLNCHHSRKHSLGVIRWQECDKSVKDKLWLTRPNQEVNVGVYVIIPKRLSFYLFTLKSNPGLSKLNRVISHFSNVSHVGVPKRWSSMDTGHKCSKSYEF